MHTLIHAGRAVDIYAKFDVIVSFIKRECGCMVYTWSVYERASARVRTASVCDSQNLAAERSYNNLDITLKEALKHRAPVSLQFGTKTTFPTHLWYCLYF